jgi:phosphatidylinositol glycan class U
VPQPYLRLLAASLLLALAPPLAMRLGRRRPLALFVLQLLALGFLK